MRVTATIAGSIEAILAAGADEISGALRHGIETASSGLLVELRAQIRSAGLGPKLEKAWQREVYPRTRKRTFHPAALVYSKSTVLHDAFDRGPTIVGQASRFLVIPTEAGRRPSLGQDPRQDRRSRRQGCNLAPVNRSSNYTGIRETLAGAAEMLALLRYHPGHAVAIRTPCSNPAGVCSWARSLSARQPAARGPRLPGWGADRHRGWPGRP